MNDGAIAALLVMAMLVGAGVGYLVGHSAPNTAESTCIETRTLTQRAESTTSQTSTSSYPDFITKFYYRLSINYSGSWSLVYWAHNGTFEPNEKTIPGKMAPYNIQGNLRCAGNYKTEVTTYGVGYVENWFCAQATKLDSQSGVILTLGVLSKTNSTTASNPSAEVCFTYAV
jgi:hypothetical protein